MINRELRDYEISVWSLQDEFITVLKPSGYEYKGQTQNAEITLNIDGTQELSFDIPMYLYFDGIKQENPAWYNARNNSIVLTGMRKIKVIINKKTEDEEIFEFIVTKVTEKHEKNALICNVECEGLAFHELGKTGFKITLTEEDYYKDSSDWEQNKKWIDVHGREHEEAPVNNIQYWLNKFLLTEEQAKELKNKQQWYYTINMDWSSYDNITKKDSNKIYENPYIASYNFDTSYDDLIVTPARVEASREKCRLVNLEESNRYNLTQDLAETFEVYCRYIYHYDENYYIIGREVQFYNNYLSENKNAFDLTYKYNSSSISRESDSTELVTKMYIKSAEMESNLDSEVTVIDVDANLSGENYILNFDYLKEIGSISDEAYKEVKIFEKNVGMINRELKPLSNVVNTLSNELNSLEAEITTCYDSIMLDGEQYNKLETQIQTIVNNETGAGTRGSNNPYKAFARKDNNTGLYYVDINQQGVINDNNLKAYYKKNGLINIKFSRVTNQYGYVEKIDNIFLPSDLIDFTIFIEFKYRAKEYLEANQKEWALKRAQDENQLIILQNKKEKYQTLLNEYTSEYNKKLIEKQNLINDFEDMMGPALREGYWQPDNFHDYGDIITNNFNLINGLEQENDITSLIWDTPRIEEGEENLYDDSGIIQVERIYYPCIILSNNGIKQILKHKESLSSMRVYYLNYSPLPTGTDVNDPSNWSFLNINAGCEFGFIRATSGNEAGKIVPAIILTDVINTFSPARLKADWRVGKLDFKLDDGNNIKYEEEQWITWVAPYQCIYKDANKIENDGYERVYPRLKINSDKLKTNEEDIYLSINGTELKEFEDYNVLIHDNTQEIIDENIDISNINISYYITINSYSYIKNLIIDDNNYLQSDLVSRITLSNAATSIYLDALTVSKDSAYPQVSYKIDVDVFNKSFIKKVAKTLGHIAHINDYELKFDHVLGYVSELTLNLDKPWEDSIEIKNYKTKFEDLFQKIVAQSESMKKKSYLLNTVTQAFSATTGEIKESVFKESFARANLNYAFNKGNLTINEADGICGTSDQGVVTFRGGGIFTATQKDSAGNWIWNSGILPTGIDASAIKSGQLDTNRINIYAGDDIRFQWNGEGLFAYKELNNENGVITSNQYVQYNADGLSLIAKKGEEIASSNNTETFIQFNQQYVKRVSVGWDGLVLRDKDGNRILYADVQTGELHVQGVINAQTGGSIGGWKIEETSLLSPTKYVGLNSNPTSYGENTPIPAFYAGSTTMNSAAFRVYADGALYASNVNITGGIIDIIKNNNYRFCINSNGILIENSQIKNSAISGGSIQIGNLNINESDFNITAQNQIEGENSQIQIINKKSSNLYNDSKNNETLGIQLTYGDFNTEVFPGYIYIENNDNSNSSSMKIDTSQDSFIINGNAIVTGTKSREITTSQYSNRLLYCYETSTPMFGDIGEGTIGEDGLCYISFDPIFAQTITTDQYQVFLQTYNAGNCWVKSRTSSWFIVEGTPGLKFGWEVKAKQRDYGQLRLETSKEKLYIMPKQSYDIDAANYIEELRQGRITL